MSGVNPSEYEAARWIKETIAAAGVTAPVWRNVVPADSAMPAIRVTRQSATDTRTNAQHIAIATWRFLVVAVSPSEDDVVSLSKAVDAALHEVAGSTAELRVVACTRVGTYTNTSLENGLQYEIGGATYEVLGAAAS